MSYTCHFQNFNLGVVLVHFRLHKSISKFHTCTKKRRGIVKPTFRNEASAVEPGKWAYGPMVGSAYPTQRHLALLGVSPLQRRLSVFSIFYFAIFDTSTDVPLMRFWKTEPGMLFPLLSSTCVPKLSSIGHFWTVGRRPFGGQTGSILVWQHLSQCSSLLQVQDFHWWKLGGRPTPHTLLEVCSSHKDKIENKCMGSAGGKIPVEPNFHFPLALGTLKRIRLMLCALFILVTSLIR